MESMLIETKEGKSLEITPQMVESGLDALFVSGLVEWNKPRMAYRGVVQRILAAGLSEFKPS